jgi:hypothetical protein
VLAACSFFTSLQLCRTAVSTEPLPLALPVLDAKAAPLEAAVRPRPIPAVAHVDPVLSAALSTTRPVLTARTASIASTALDRRPPRRAGLLVGRMIEVFYFQATGGAHTQLAVDRSPKELQG